MAFSAQILLVGDTKHISAAPVIQSVSLWQTFWAPSLSRGKIFTTEQKRSLLLLLWLLLLYSYCVDRFVVYRCWHVVQNSCQFLCYLSQLIVTLDFMIIIRLMWAF